MIIGPQVAFVDDVEEQIRPLENALQDLNAGTIFFDARPEESLYPEVPISTVKLLFLDLYYESTFDPFAPAQWVESIIPPNSKYALIIWSKDTDQSEEVLAILKDLDRSPDYMEVWQKTEFDMKTFNFSEKISLLLNNMSSSEDVIGEVIFGEIIDVEEDAILINCRISNESPVFQVRKFDKPLLSNVKNLKNGIIVKIVIYTKPGARLIDIFEEEKDMEDWFSAPDVLKGLEGTSFFTAD